ncbi:MAG TPA: TolC family protein [Humisphaera sp.]
MHRTKSGKPMLATLRRAAALALPVLLAGCHATPPDVPGDAAALTGVADGIAFRESPDAPSSAPPAAGEALSVAAAVRLALANDPRVQASLAKVRAAEADANQARLLPNPILGIDFRFPVTGSGHTVFEPTLAADLVSLLQKPAQVSAADHRLRGSAATALVTVLDVMAEVQTAYASAWSADVEIDNAERRQQRLQQVRDLAEKRIAGGEGTRLDLLTVDAQLLQASLAVSDLRLTRVQQRLTLARLVGRPRSDADWRLSAPAPPGDQSAAPETEWIAAALAHRPEIQARVWELRALGDDLAVASLSPLAGGDVGAHAEHDGDWHLGPTLTTPLPIFDFGQAARARVTALRIAARHELVQQEWEVIQDVRLAHAAYAHAVTSLAAYQGQLLPLQRRQTEQARAAYQAGEADLATLLLAENELELTLSKIVELQEQAVVARVKLQRAAGGAGVAGRVDAAAATRPAPLYPTSTMSPTTKGAEQ